MAETIVVACPECKSKIKAPADAVGKKIRCKGEGCGTIFVIRAPGGKTAEPAKETAKATATAPAAEPPAEEEDGKIASYGVSHKEGELPRCPFCAHEMASKSAKVCINCGYDTRVRSRNEQKKTYEVEATDYFVYHLSTIGAFIVIAGVVAFALVVTFNAEKWTEGFLKSDDGTWWLRPSSFMVYAWLFVGGVSWVCLKFIFKRLFVSFTPPEVENK